MTHKKLIPVIDLEPDTYYDAPLWLDENFMVFSNDTPVSQGIIDALKFWGYKSVITEGSIVSGWSPESATARAVSGGILVNDAKESEGRKTAENFFSLLAHFIKTVYQSFHRNGNLDVSSITEIIKKTIGIIKDFRPYILRLPSLQLAGLEYLYTHCARVTILSLTLGEQLKLPNFRLIELGIAALMHGVGIMKIPRQVYDKASAFTEAERKLMNTHSLQAYKMLQEFSRDNANPLAQNIIMGVGQHQERLDGSGYPQGLSGERISVNARIIGVASTYDALITHRPQRKAYDSYSALLMILKDKKSLYDENVILALLASLSIYPLGNWVRMNDGSTGMVVETHKDPKYPKVRLYLDKDLHIYKDQPVIETKKTGGIHIKSILDEEEKKDFLERKLLPS